MEEVTIVSSDDVSFKVDKNVAEKSETIRHLIEDTGISEPIKLPSVDGKILQKILEYAKYHHEHPSEDEDVKKWDQEFIPSHQDELFSIILGANYLDMNSLLDLLCKHVASMIKGKSTEEIRTTFNIKNDFTPEEEQVRKENEWCDS